MVDNISAYAQAQTKSHAAICRALRRSIDAGLPNADSKIWHGGPVWFLDGNPIVGYSKRKDGIQLLFWSGWSFDEPKLKPVGNVDKYKAAGFVYTKASELNNTDITRWLRKAKTIQWDYKNIIKRRGRLVRLRRSSH